MAVNIVWDKVPAEVKESLEPYLERYVPLLPTWVQEFECRWGPTSDARMAAKINYRNRWAVLLVTPHWLSDNEVERENSVRHEFIHILLAPLMEAVDLIIESNIEKDTPVHKLSDKTYRNAMEASVEDTARAIERLLSDATRRLGQHHPPPPQDLEAGLAGY